VLIERRRLLAAFLTAALKSCAKTGTKQEDALKKFIGMHKNLRRYQDMFQIGSEVDDGNDDGNDEGGLGLRMDHHTQRQHNNGTLSGKVRFVQDKVSSFMEVHLMTVTMSIICFILLFTLVLLVLKRHDVLHL
jgi:hypothetical protein